MSSVAQSRLTLCDPMDYGLPGSSVYGIFSSELKLHESPSCGEIEGGVGEVLGVEHGGSQ